MGQGVRIGLGNGGITCVLQTEFSSFREFTCLHRQTNPLTYQKYIKNQFRNLSISKYFPLFSNNGK